MYRYLLNFPGEKWLPQEEKQRVQQLQIVSCAGDHCKMYDVWVVGCIKMGLRQFGMLGSNHAKNGEGMSPIGAHMYDEYEMETEGYYYGPMYTIMNMKLVDCGASVPGSRSKNKKIEFWVEEG